MSLLFDLVNKNVASPLVQTAADFVGTAVRPTGHTVVSSDGTLLQPREVTQPAVINQPFVPTPSSPGLHIPQNMQIPVQIATEEAIRYAMQKYGPSQVTGARELVDVAQKAFQGNIGVGTFTQLNRAVAALAPKYGATLGKANRIINIASMFITKGVKQGAAQAPGLFGTTRLGGADFARYTNQVVSNVKQQFVDAGLDTQQLTQIVRQGSIPDARTLPSLGDYENAISNVADSSDLLGLNRNESVVDAQQLQQQSSVGASNADDSEGRKVYLRSAYNTNAEHKVVFVAQPKISITENAEYDTLYPIHAPTGFVSFKTSPNRKITIDDIKFFARTSEEATENLKRLHMLRSWLKPYFGKLSGVGGSGTTETKMIGAPPDILYLYAYASPEDNGYNLNKIPVVLESISYSYPNDVDYIPTSAETGGIPFPVLLGLNISLLETHSPFEAEQFSISDYRQGKMLSW